MAYLIGLLLADGCVMIRGNSYTLDLTSKDIELIQYLVSELNVTNPIKQSKCGKYFNVGIYSKEIVLSLAKFGIVPRKSRIAKYPNIPSKFDADFIRGYFDGDGGIWSAPEHGKIRLYWAGSDELLQQTAKRLASYCGIRLNKPTLHSSGSIFQLIYCHSGECLKIFKFLYPKNCKLFLRRKNTKITSFFFN